MTFTLLTQKISFSAENNLLEIARTMISTTKKEVDMIISNVLKDSFDFDSFSLTTYDVNFKNLVGLYLIVNRKSRKFYLGSSIDLAQRKREYRSYLNTNSKKLYKTMREDRVTGQASDFYFVPLVGFHRTNVTGFINASQQAINKSLRTFLDFEVEEPLFVSYLDPKAKYASLFYNKKTIGIFVKGNVEGGSFQSGLPNQPLMFENYAWESVSAAAKSLEKDRKSIRLQRNPGKFKAISIEEFQNFAEIRISNASASTFFKDRPEELLKLKRKLGLR